MLLPLSVDWGALLMLYVHGQTRSTGASFGHICSCSLSLFGIGSLPESLAVFFGGQHQFVCGGVVVIVVILVLCCCVASHDDERRLRWETAQSDVVSRCGCDRFLLPFISVCGFDFSFFDGLTRPLTLTKTFSQRQLFACVFWINPTRFHRLPLLASTLSTTEFIGWSAGRSVGRPAVKKKISVI